tara:strand:- start:52 stop:849 length:798 start_codon:yes stop_codon:yes gene_type:complete
LGPEKEHDYFNGMTLPVFKSHYSLGRSILTLSHEEDDDRIKPASIINLCEKNDFKKLCLVEDSMSGFLEAYINSKEAGIELMFGLRLSVCPDMNEKDEESVKNSSKYIVFCLNSDGYKDLIKIHDLASKDGFYYKPRIDFKNLKKLWTNNLKLCVPFYDSFIHNNILLGGVSIPEFDFTKSTVFFTEDNGLPFDDLLLGGVSSFADSEGHEVVQTKSIFYENKEDFKAYLTFRCINNRSTLNKPQLEHMTSDEFCLESWKEQNAN